MQMGGYGFGINLFPGMKEAVAKSDMTQQRANQVVEKMGRMWLDACGYAAMHDPDQADPMAAWEARRLGKPLKLGPNAKPLYDTWCIRVSWGEWGVEHLTVPGDACGLDIDRGFGGMRGGVTLQPHNVDNSSQVLLLLVVFTWFADYLVADERQREYEQELCKTRN